jgi:hypothetical protein
MKSKDYWIKIMAKESKEQSFGMNKSPTNRTSRLLLAAADLHCCVL